MNIIKKQLVSIIMACVAVQSSIAESLSLNGPGASAQLQVAPAMHMSAPVSQVKPANVLVQPMNTVQTVAPSPGTVPVAPKAQLKAAPVMQAPKSRPAQSSGFAPVTPRPSAFTAKPSISSGTVKVAPKAQVKAVPVMQAPKSRPAQSSGFAPVTPRSPAITAKPSISSDVKEGVNIKSELQVPPSPSFQQKPANVKQINGFAPIGSFAQQNKDGRCQPLKDIWQCKKPTFINMFQSKKILKGGKSVVNVELTMNNAKALKIWLDDGSNRLLFDVDYISRGGKRKMVVPVSGFLNYDFKDNTPIRLEISNPHGKTVSKLKLVNNPLNVSGLNLSGKNDVAIPKGGFGTASSMPGTSKTLKKVSQQKLLEPRIFKFAPSRGSKGRDNSYVIGENMSYTLDYQVRFADEIVFKYDGRVMWRKKGLDPNEIISDSINIDSIADRTFNNTNQKKFEDYTLEVIRHSGFVVKKAQQSIKMVYSAAKYAPRLPVFEIMDIRYSEKPNLLAETAKIHVVFENAQSISIEHRNINSGWRKVKLDGEWNRKLSKEKHVLYHKIILAPGVNEFRVTLKTEGHEPVSKTISVQGYSIEAKWTDARETKANRTINIISDINHAKNIERYYIYFKDKDTGRVTKVIGPEKYTFNNSSFGYALPVTRKNVPGKGQFAVKVCSKHGCAMTGYSNVVNPYGKLRRLNRYVELEVPIKATYKNSSGGSDVAPLRFYPVCKPTSNIKMTGVQFEEDYPGAGKVARGNTFTLRQKGAVNHTYNLKFRFVPVDENKNIVLKCYIEKVAAGNVNSDWLSSVSYPYTDYKVTNLLNMDLKIPNPVVRHKTVTVSIDPKKIDLGKMIKVKTDRMEIDVDGWIYRPKSHLWK